MSSIRNFLPLTLLLIASSIEAVGWYPPKKGPVAISVSVNPHEGSPVIALLQKRRVLLHALKKEKLRLVRKVDLPANVKATKISADSNSLGKTLIAVQVGGSQSRVMMGAVDRKSTRWWSPERASGGSARLFDPQVLSLRSGNFVVLYNQTFERNGKVFYGIRVHLIDKDKFAVLKTVNLNPPSGFSGIFFPKVTEWGSKILVLYQARNGRTYKDEIRYRLLSKTDLRVSAPKRVQVSTSTQMSADVKIIDGKPYFVWQEMKNKTWAVFSKYGNKVRQLSENQRDSVSPKISFSKRSGVFVSFKTAVSSGWGLAGIAPDEEGTFFSVPRVYQTFSSPISHFALAESSGFLFAFWSQKGRLHYAYRDEFASKLRLKSRSHPDHAVNHTADFEAHWDAPKDPSGVSGYAWLLDSKKDSVPGLFNLPPETKLFRLKNLEDQIYYFHLRYKDGAGNLSSVSHYRFGVDRVPPVKPEIQSTTHPENVGTSSGEIRLRFSATDNVGVKYFRYAFSKNRAARLKKKTKKDRLTLIARKSGKYYLKVIAVDYAGNQSPENLYRIVVDLSDSLGPKAVLEKQRIQDVAGSIPAKLIVKAAFRKKIKGVRYVFSRDEPSDPAQEGELLDDEEAIAQLNQKQGSQQKVTVSFPLKLGKSAEGKIPADIYLLNIRFLYDDDSYSDLLALPFEVIKKKEKKPEKQKIRPSPQKKLDLRPQILVEGGPNNYQVSFAVKKRARRFLLHYEWYVAEEPLPPDWKEASVSYGGPEVLDNLRGNHYWVRARAVYKKRKWNQRKRDSYVYIFRPPSEPVWQLPHWHWFAGIFLSLFFLLMLIPSVRFRMKRAIFWH